MQALTPTEQRIVTAMVKAGRTLVRMKPSDLSVRRRLTDGQSFYIVDDINRRANAEDTMVKLRNEEHPTVGGWFRLGDFWLQLYYAGWERT